MAENYIPLAPPPPTLCQTKKKKPKKHVCKDCAIFTYTDCCVCGIPFAMAKTLARFRLKDGKTHWCPNGHQQHFIPGKKKKPKPKKRVAAPKRKIDIDE